MGEDSSLVPRRGKNEHAVRDSEVPETFQHAASASSLLFTKSATRVRETEAQAGQVQSGERCDPRRVAGCGWGRGPDLVPGNLNEQNLVGVLPPPHQGGRPACRATLMRVCVHRTTCLGHILLYMPIWTC